METIQHCIYKSNDGNIFLTEKECERYESSKRNQINSGLIIDFLLKHGFVKTNTLDQCYHKHFDYQQVFEFSFYDNRLITLTTYTNTNKLMSYRLENKNGTHITIDMCELEDFEVLYKILRK